ncbi:TIM-barrel domain-containing protein [Metabacillus indicus]|uniref:glycoside hydrolase family 31 protein n=1 Tax=Metabacillus indicus TaxID=246786 RepID=UPI003CFAF89D
MSIHEPYQFNLIEEDRNILTFQHEHIKAHIFILEKDIMRVLFSENKGLKLKQTWSIAPGLEDVPFEGRDRFDVTGFSLPDYRTVKDSGTMIIETDLLKMVVQLNGFKASWYVKRKEEWVLIAKDRSTQAYHFDYSKSSGPAHYLERNLEEQYFGFGEKTGSVDKHGKRYRMETIDAMGYDAEFTDPLYKHIPFYMTRNQQTGVTFGLFYDNLSSSIFEMGSELDNYHGLYRYFQAEDGDLDYYILAGPRVQDVTERFAWMTGKTIMPPKWSLGYSGSTMSYTDAPNAQEQLMEFLELCRKHDILCDSFQLSSGYTSIEDKRYVFTWNDGKFPDPEQFIRDFQENGLKLCANIKPCLLKDHPFFNDLSERKMFIGNKLSQEAEMAQFWDETGSYLDFTNKETYSWWKEQVKDKLLSYGIDSTWNDNNEFEIWSREAVCNGFGETLDFETIRALHPLLMMKASYEAQLEQNPEKRPYLISRSGSPGMHRYVQTWTGDNRTSWKTLKYNIKMGIGMSLSGLYNFGHDVGGFSGPAPEPELFVRWIQNGVMHPRFTIHSWNDDQTVNEPWMYPERLPEIRNLIKFRTKLLPYFYTALYESHAGYKPIIRPTFYDFEHDEQTFKENDDFMAGEALLVASVVEKGDRVRSVYLPDHSAGWYDVHTGEWFESGQTAVIPAPLDYVPLLAKAGSIIPVNTADVTFRDKNKDERAFLLFPAKEEDESSYRLYEDDGESALYQEIFAYVTVGMKTTDTDIFITVEKEGSYVLPYETVAFILPVNENRTLTVNGTKCASGEAITLFGRGD